MRKSFELHETISRVLKISIDDGAPSIEAARREMETWGVIVAIGPEVERSPTLQAAVLTAVAIGRRCFLGGINVIGNVDVPLLIPWPTKASLRAAIVSLGGRADSAAIAGAPCIRFGSHTEEVSSSIVLQVTFDGWCSGVAPANRRVRLAESQEFTPSGVLGAALAVSEVFQYFRGANPMAARREVGLSLWRPDLQWTDPEAIGMKVTRLPSSLWLLGLGHLGQAYAWTIGLLPYARPETVKLFVLDFDDVVPGNESTGLLISETSFGRRKARVVAEWLDHRGFNTFIVERRFAGPMTVTDQEPRLALIGFDNGPSRARLDGAFPRAIDCGLGTGVQDHLGITLRTLPGSRRASERWETIPPATTSANLVELPGYARMATEGLDECGLTLVAGVTVGVPFVGAAAAALVVAEAIRSAIGAHAYDFVALHLRNPALVEVAPNSVWDAEPFNPGISPTR